jgi:hypothetical protein
MSEMLQDGAVDSTPPKAIVDIDPFLAIIMQSDMARAFPHIAAAMVNERKTEWQQRG